MLYLLVLGQFGWMMSHVMELSPNSLTVLPIHWGVTTVSIVVTLE
jgi:hypothetical protein